MKKSLRNQFEEFCIDCHLYYNFEYFEDGYENYNTHSAFIVFKNFQNYFIKKIA